MVRCPVLNIYFMKLTEQPPKVFYKKAVFKNFAVFTGKYLCWGLFLIKLPAFRSATLLERDSNTGVFPGKFLRKYILKNSSELTLGSDCLELLFLDSRFQNHPDSVML